jgi:hypothetical protein
MGGVSAMGVLGVLVFTLLLRGSRSLDLVSKP